MYLKREGNDLGINTDTTFEIFYVKVLVQCSWILRYQTIVDCMIFANFKPTKMQGFLKGFSTNGLTNIQNKYRSKSVLLRFIVIKYSNVNQLKQSLIGSKKLPQYIPFSIFTKLELSHSTFC